ncbi:MAG: zinc ABC transporter substrate-binding protein [Fimbriimonadaceae bacterium]|jgi:manganese/zinc/iron transport system substrate-binding protein|nr:zinc ABC transporter substrate-binding protein [Fimbriimonadaceae bacterium]
MGLQKLVLITALTFGLLLVGCVSQPSADSIPDKPGQLKVVTTTGMLGDLVERVGGDRISVKSLMGPGVDPHLYQAKSSDLLALDQADLIVFHGIGLEGRMARIFTQQKDKAFEAAALDPSLLLKADNTTEPDPHIWFDLDLWGKVAERVTQELSRRDPAGKSTFEANLRSYQADLEKAKSEVTEILRTIPPKQRVLVTAHDAFQYFGRAYGFEIRAIQGTNTASEAGASQIRTLADILTERKIQAIFVETSVSSTTIGALQQATEARGWQVKIGGSLFSDAMGDQGSESGSVIGMNLSNAKTIAEALR